MRFSKRVILAWIPVVVMLGVIVLESSELSSSETGGILHPIFNWIWMVVFGHRIPYSTFFFLHALTRKMGHFVGYGLMCYFLFRAWRITFQERCESPSGSAQWYWDQRWAVLAIVGTFLIASGDEIHQSFDASRTGAFHDVVLDCAGGAVALWLAWIVEKRRRRVGMIAQQGD